MIERVVMAVNSALQITEELSHLLKKTATQAGLSESGLAESILYAGLRSRETRLYQISSTAALVQGVLQGTLSSARLLESGNFGVGTFENLDGEMIVLNGQIFQMCADGRIKQRLDEFEVPFAQVCRFVSPRICRFSQIRDFASLEAACTLLRTSDNLFHAFRIEAQFDVVHARTVRRGPEGASLESAGGGEAKFTWRDVSGCLVGFWSPSFTSSFSVPGYHFHFISDDRTRGGHVLDCSFQAAAAGVQVLTEYEVAMPSSGPFLRADLSVDTRAVLRKVE